MKPREKASKGGQGAAADPPHAIGVMPPHKIQHKMNVLRERELPPLMLKPIDPEQLLGVVELQLSGALQHLDDAQGADSPG